VSETTTPLRLGVDPRFTDRERQPGLDLLRAPRHHRGGHLPPPPFSASNLPGRVDRFGWIGVDLFFVLSGYLIGGQLLARRSRAGGRPIDLRRFFFRPAAPLRIIPGLLLRHSCCFIAFCAVVARSTPEMSPPFGNLSCRCKTLVCMAATAFFPTAWSLCGRRPSSILISCPLMLILVSRWPRARFIIPWPHRSLAGSGWRTFLAMAEFG